MACGVTYMRTERHEDAERLNWCLKALDLRATVEASFLRKTTN